MTQIAIAEDIRLRLAQSMPEVDPRRGAIARKMQERLQEFETPDEDFGQAEVTAILLVELLVELPVNALLGLLRLLGRFFRDIDLPGP